MVVGHHREKVACKIVHVRLGELLDGVQKERRGVHAHNIRHSYQKYEALAFGRNAFGFGMTDVGAAKKIQRACIKLDIGKSTTTTLHIV